MKLEKEIMELIKQRNLAQSRLLDLLSSVGDDQALRRSVESSQLSVQSASIDQPFRQLVLEDSIQPSIAHHQYGASEDESSISEVSSICYQSTHPVQTIARTRSGGSEDQCKEVRCIKINDLKKGTTESSLLLDEVCDSLEENNGGIALQNQADRSLVSFETKTEVLCGAPGKLEEVTEPHNRKQLVHNQEIHQNPSKKDANTETPLSHSESTSQWSSEFKKQQREIMELWDTCHVSLIHRTYFFLLFNGDPSDSVYMEVELRRLSFLNKRNETETSNISLKYIQHERAMLHRRIQKKLSAKERNHFYIKWGIKLASKQRAMQLAKLLFTDTKNIEHVEDSALLVAKLIGILEPKLALKGDVWA